VQLGVGLQGAELQLGFEAARGVVSDGGVVKADGALVREVAVGAAVLETYDRS
jgi:hypothetical protein